MSLETKLAKMRDYLTAMIYCIKLTDMGFDAGILDQGKDCRQTYMELLISLTEKW